MPPSGIPWAPAGTGTADLPGMAFPCAGGCCASKGLLCLWDELGEGRNALFHRRERQNPGEFQCMELRAAQTKLSWCCSCTLLFQAAVYFHWRRHSSPVIAGRHGPAIYGKPVKERALPSALSALISEQRSQSSQGPLPLGFTAHSPSPAPSLQLWR